MKKLFSCMCFAGFIFLFTGCAGMEIAPDHERVVQVVHETTLPKEAIFSGAQEWMALTFNDSKQVIEYKDIASGKIIGKGSIRYSPDIFLSIPIRFTMVIEIKDGKYRATYSDYECALNCHPSYSTAKEYVDLIKQRISALDGNLFNYLEGKSKSGANW